MSECADTPTMQGFKDGVAASTCAGRCLEPVKESYWSDPPPPPRCPNPAPAALPRPPPPRAGAAHRRTSRTSRCRAARGSRWASDACARATASAAPRRYPTAPAAMRRTRPHWRRWRRWEHLKIPTCTASYRAIRSRRPISSAVGSFSRRRRRPSRGRPATSRLTTMTVSRCRSSSAGCAEIAPRCRRGSRGPPHHL